MEKLVEMALHWEGHHYYGNLSSFLAALIAILGAVLAFHFGADVGVKRIGREKGSYIILVQKILSLK